MRRILCVGVGGGIGSLLRYGMQVWIQNRLGAALPYGTLLVNVSGAFAIGLLMAVLLNHLDLAVEWRLFFVVGILGGYTTFSSFMWEAHELVRAGGWWPGTAYVMSSIIGGAIGVCGGVWVGRWVNFS